MGVRRLGLRCVGVACLAAPAFLVAPAPAQPDPDPPRRTIVYGGDASFPPFEWLDPRGVPRGYQIDLVRAIARELDIDIQIRLGPWHEIRDDLLRGEIDLVCMFDQPARRETFDFAQPHSFHASEIFIRRGGREVAGLADLGGLIVIVQEGALAQDQINAMGVHAVFYPVPTEAEAIRVLADGRGDCAIVTQYGGRNAIRDGGYDRITTTGPPVLMSPVGFAAPKGRSEILSLMDEGVARLKSSGAFSAIADRWTPDLSRPNVPVASAVRYAAWVMLPLLALALGAVAWSWALRTKVRARTRQLDLELAERRRAEESLRRSQERLRIALQHARITIADQDRSLRYDWTCDGIPDRSNTSAIGRRDEDLFDPAVAASLVEAKTRALETGHGEILEIVTGAPEHARHWEVLIEPRRDELGQIVGVTTASVDVTTIKQGEAERLDLQRRILQAQKAESLGLMAGGVAHDVANLMAAVVGNTEALRRLLPQDTPAARHVDLIEQTGKAANELTTHLFTLAGRERLMLHNVDLGAIIDQAVDLARASTPPRIEIELLPHDRVVLECDPVLARQVVLNLLRNAADAMRDRPGIIRVRLGARRVEPRELALAAIGRDTPPSAFAFVEVSDQGEGIAPDSLPRIFDPFYSTRGAGRGLGLALIASIVRRHAGAVLVESQVGAGTTFRVLFPLMVTEQPA